MFSKHIDSHVKSYRCRESSCVTISFSSATCMLRHEREIHGKHDHGEKSHLCAFVGCDRSVPGNGFSRHWNRSDHMKRVHDYDEAASFNESELFTISSANSFNQDTGTLTSRRRRTSSASRTKSRKQTKSFTSKLINASKDLATSIFYEKQRLFMKQQWLKQKVAVKDCLDHLNSDDILEWEKINNDYAVLQVVGLSIRRQLKKLSHIKCASHWAALTIWRWQAEKKWWGHDQEF